MGQACHSCALEKPIAKSPEPEKRSSWKEYCTRSLSQLFESEQNEAWFHELLAVIHSWVDGVEEPFERSHRWNEYATLSSDNSQLRFQLSNKESTGGPKSVFDVLSIDIADPRNPIGALVSTFKTIYSTVNHDKVQELVDQKRREEAAFVLAEVVSIILRFEDVLKGALKVFYPPLVRVVESRPQDTEAMLMTHLVQGDLFLMVERLANLVYVEVVKSRGDEEGKTDFEPQVLKEMKDSWLRFVACESVCEKKEMIESLESQLSSLKVDSVARGRLIQYSSFDVPSVLPHLHITKLLSTCSDHVLESYLQVLDQLPKRQNKV